MSVTAVSSGPSADIGGSAGGREGSVDGSPHYGGGLAAGGASWSSTSHRPDATAHTYRGWRWLGSDGPTAILGRDGHLELSVSRDGTTTPSLASVPFTLRQRVPASFLSTQPDPAVPPPNQMRPAAAVDPETVLGNIRGDAQRARTALQQALRAADVPRAWTAPGAPAHHALDAMFTPEYLDPWIPLLLDGPTDLPPVAHPSLPGSTLTPRLRIVPESLHTEAVSAQLGVGAESNSMTSTVAGPYSEVSSGVRGGLVGDGRTLDESRGDLRGDAQGQSSASNRSMQLPLTGREHETKLGGSVRILGGSYRYEVGAVLTRPGRADLDITGTVRGGDLRLFIGERDAEALLGPMPAEVRAAMTDEKVRADAWRAADTELVAVQHRYDELWLDTPAEDRRRLESLRGEATGRIATDLRVAGERYADAAREWAEAKTELDRRTAQWVQQRPVAPAPLPPRARRLGTIPEDDEPPAPTRSGRSTAPGDPGTVVHQPFRAPETPTRPQMDAIRVALDDRGLRSSRDDSFEIYQRWREQGLPVPPSPTELARAAVEHADRNGHTAEGRLAAAVTDRDGRPRPFVMPDRWVHLLQGDSADAALAVVETWHGTPRLPDSDHGRVAEDVVAAGLGTELTTVGVGADAWAAVSATVRGAGHGASAVVEAARETGRGPRTVPAIWVLLQDGDTQWLVDPRAGAATRVGPDGLPAVREVRAAAVTGGRAPLPLPSHSAVPETAPTPEPTPRTEPAVAGPAADRSGPAGSSLPQGDRPGDPTEPGGSGTQSPTVPPFVVLDPGAVGSATTTSSAPRTVDDLAWTYSGSRPTAAAELHEAWHGQPHAPREEPSGPVGTRRMLERTFGAPWTAVGTGPAALGAVIDTVRAAGPGADAVVWGAFERDPAVPPTGEGHPRLIGPTHWNLLNDGGTVQLVELRTGDVVPATADHLSYLGRVEAVGTGADGVPLVFPRTDHRSVPRPPFADDPTAVFGLHEPIWQQLRGSGLDGHLAVHDLWWGRPRATPDSGATPAPAATPDPVDTRAPTESDRGRRNVRDEIERTFGFPPVEIGTGPDAWARFADALHGGGHGGSGLVRLEHPGDGRVETLSLLQVEGDVLVLTPSDGGVVLAEHVVVPDDARLTAVGVTSTGDRVRAVPADEPEPFVPGPSVPEAPPVDAVPAARSGRAEPLHRTGPRWQQGHEPAADSEQLYRRDVVWDAQRAAAPVTLVRADAITVLPPGERDVGISRFADLAPVEVRRYEVFPGHFVRELTAAVRLVGDPAAVAEATALAVEQLELLNYRYRLPGGDQLHLSLDLSPTRPEHQVVVVEDVPWVRGQSPTSHQERWQLDQIRGLKATGSAVAAHELSHVFGLPDRYGPHGNAAAVGGTVAYGALMGPDGIPVYTEADLARLDALFGGPQLPSRPLPSVTTPTARDRLVPGHHQWAAIQNVLRELRLPVVRDDRPEPTAPDHPTASGDAAATARRTTGTRPTARRCWTPTTRGGGGPPRFPSTSTRSPGRPSHWPRCATWCAICSRSPPTGRTGSRCIVGRGRSWRAAVSTGTWRCTTCGVDAHGRSSPSPPRMRSSRRSAPRWRRSAPASPPGCRSTTAWSTAVTAARRWSGCMTRPRDEPRRCR
ncbi:hypothetical protein [Pseudonocardia sp. ICBG601]|uniref:hypothetical protein n=1 Tax=Pseudonocardia sp. ICBG601 TaxID=2846759 RepID=UPI001CF619E8|nr:hypothetical protein [Pseudonocardia sp. ICBG601]